MATQSQTFFRAPTESVLNPWRRVLSPLSRQSPMGSRGELPSGGPLRRATKGPLAGFDPSADHFVCTLDDLPLRFPAVIQVVNGERAFRRRLMELGLVPGTPVWVVNVAPLRDPLEIEVRGCRLSIRRAEARMLQVVANSHLPEGGVEV